MAKKNFATMTSKKLTALLETANEADAAEIKKILEARSQKVESAEEAPAPAAEAPAAPATEEQKAETKAAPAAETEEQKAAREKAEEEAREALTAELKEKNVGHKCKVVPFGQIEYVEGTIIGVMHDKRNKKVMYAIRLADGRRILKSHGANYFEILKEVDTEATVKAKRAPRTSTGTKKELDPNWDAKAEAAKHFEHVGKLITVDENTEARITAIVPDKRSQRILYRAEYNIERVVDDKTEVEVKVIHKTSSEELIASLKTDDKTDELNAKYVKRQEEAANREPSTPKTYEQKLADMDARITKVQETLKKLQEQRTEMVAKHEAAEAAEAEKPAEATEAAEKEELA